MCNDVRLPFTTAHLSGV